VATQLSQPYDRASPTWQRLCAQDGEPQSSGQFSGVSPGWQMPSLHHGALVVVVDDVDPVEVVDVVEPVIAPLPPDPCPAEPPTPGSSKVLCPQLACRTQAQVKSARVAPGLMGAW